MKSISVNTGKPYKVQIKAGIRHRTGEILAAAGWRGRIALLSDDRVFPLHGEAVKASLTQAGFQALAYTFPNGEKSKNMRTVACTTWKGACTSLSRTFRT